MKMNQKMIEFLPVISVLIDEFGIEDLSVMFLWAVVNLVNTLKTNGRLLYVVRTSQ